MKGISRIIIFALIATLVSVSFFAGFYLNEQKYKRFFSSDDMDLTLLKEAYFWVQRDFVHKDKIDSKALLYGAIRGMVDSLKDPYTVFFAPDEAKRFLEDTDGKLEGIGIELGFRDGFFKVIAPIKNTPADKAGIRPGDIILKVDGVDTYPLNIDEVVAMIRGERGTDIILTIIRNGWERERDITITREIIELPSIEWELIDGFYAHLTIHHFFKDTGVDLKNVALEIVSSPAEGIILDLRSNSGGYLEVAEEVGGWFLPKGEVMLIEEGKSRREHIVSGNETFLEYPTVILINRGTASAAEILAGALRDVRNMKIMGEKSFGKGSIQRLEILRDGSAIKMTIAEWFTPSGEVITEKGISPDFEVVDNDNDEQLKRAIEVLREMI